MSLPPTPEEASTARRESIVREEVERYPGLLPGAAQEIARRLQQHAYNGPHVLAEEVAKFLESPAGQRLHDPEYAPPLLSNGRVPSTLRQALMRYPELKAKSVELLHAEWAAGMAGMSAPRVAAEVAKRLARKDVQAEHFRDPAAPARAEPEPARRPVVTI
jgi:hypothetical protein